MPTVEENIAVRSSRKLVAERTVLAKGKFDLGAAVHHDGNETSENCCVSHEVYVSM